MKLLLSFIITILIIQVYAYNTNRGNGQSDLRHEKLVAAIKKFYERLNLQGAVRDFLSMNQGQMMMKMNQIRSAVNIGKDEMGLIMGKIAEKFDNFKVEDMANLSEGDIVNAARKFITLCETYQSLIMGKIFEACEVLGFDKKDTFESISDLGEVCNILAEPNMIEELVQRYSNEIKMVINSIVNTVRVYDLQPVIDEVISGIKSMASRSE